MSKANDKELNYLWSNINEEEFENEVIDSEDIGEYNLEKEKLFIANINYSRQIPKLMDGLKTVERRIIYSMYNIGAFPGKATKCNKINGEVINIHPHGQMNAYKALVGMAQYWKKGVRLIKGIGNFGNPALTEGYAADRYTEATLSKFAYDCYFSDYDPDCVDMINTTVKYYEPLQLPAKYPNILINGGVGIAVGNKLGIPTYHVDDIYNLFKRLMKNPDDPDIYMIPEIPTGCDIVDDGRSLKEICETGTGILRMRARIDIEEEKNFYVLHVMNLPWFVSLEKVTEKLVQLTKSGKLPIKDIQDRSQAYKDKKGEVKTLINYRILISKAQDPYQVRELIYKNTELASSLTVKFKIVNEDLRIQNINMRDLVLTWLDERREYKRRLYNKRISKNKARLALLDILIELLDKDNLDKTVGIIRSNARALAEFALVRDYGMSSYQASKIVEMPLYSFTKDAREKYIEEREKVVNDIELTMKTVKSKKKIDDIILTELEEMKKYGKPKECRIVSSSDAQVISNSNHIVVVSKKGMIKKLPYNPNKAMNNGAFLQGDYPLHRVEVNNLDAIMLFSSTGRYSIIPVSSIRNTEVTNSGTKVFDISKLDGEIILVTPYIDSEIQTYIKEHGSSINLITLSKYGYIKRTDISDLKLQTGIKNYRYAKTKDNSDDEIVFAQILLDNTDLILYSKRGNYSYTSVKDLPLLSKDSQGVMSIPIKDNDAAKGFCAIGEDTDYIVLLTDKGYMKRIELSSLGDLKRRRQSTYISSISDNDNLFRCDSIRENSEITVCNRNAMMELKVEDIPLLSRRAMPQKVVPVSLGDNIIEMIVRY